MTHAPHTPHEKVSQAKLTIREALLEALKNSKAYSLITANWETIETVDLTESKAFIQGYGADWKKVSLALEKETFEKALWGHLEPLDYTPGS